MPTATQRQAVVFHGYRATPGDHWFPWLARTWTEAGTPTTVPPLPRSDAPAPAAWRAAVADHLRRLATAPGGLPAATVVAHSLGAAAVLRVLADTAALAPGDALGSLVLVSPFVDPLPALPELDAHVTAHVDLGPVRSAARTIRVLRSDHDPLVPTGHSDGVATALGVVAEVVPGAGHFLAADGVTELPELTELGAVSRTTRQAPSPAPGAARAGARQR